jgi:hypothetical protein
LTVVEAGILSEAVEDRAFEPPDAEAKVPFTQA